MCGIAGFLGPAGPQAEFADIARRMADTLAHRGPDGSGVFADGEAGVGLGHRRLSVIDLSAAGAQPMTSADGRYVIVYNGEVYETEPIRADLEKRGVRFRGYSDTEIILESCAHFGIEATLPRLVGMFAFALWDRQRRELALVRDRFGIKPLYYGRTGKTLLFASELKALFAWPEFRPEIDRDALASYLRFNYVPSPRSIWRGISKLPPGHLVVVRQGVAGEPRAWWDLRSIAAAGVARPAPLSPKEAEDELDRLLQKAVGSRMVSDVPLGAFLSGGIDSSTVVAQMQAQSPRPIRTFTIGFAEEAYDESKAAEAIARHLGTDHTTLTVSPREARAVIPDLATWYDEPFADSSQIPTYLVSRLARGTVTVALSGDGGDELFAGYDRHSWSETLWHRVGRVPLALRGLAASVLGTIPQRGWELAGHLPGAPYLAPVKAAKLGEVLRLRDTSDVCRRLVAVWPDPAALVAGGRAEWGAYSDADVATAIPPLMERMQYLDAVTYLPDDILTKIDRASMAVSLEARVPLLDHRVAEFAFSLPRALRIENGQGKRLLRAVLARYVPRQMFERPKMGFGIPVGEWIRAQLREWAESLLTPAALAASGLASEPVRKMWAEHLDARVSRTTEIWTVLMYQAWHARWGAAARP